MNARAWGLLAGTVADAVLGDPQRHHPVAWFGSWATTVEKHQYRDSRPAGAVFLVSATAPILVAATLMEHTTRHRRWARFVLTATTTWAVLGARSLADEGHVMAHHLQQGDLSSARERITHLCSRDPEQLDAADLARATTESMAENTSDAAVGSLMWGALFGVPGLVGHRMVNTLDAMVGHRNDRYRHFGTATAWADDLVNLGPARLTGMLACICAPLVGGDPRRAWRTMWRDATDHPSPNGGWCEAAWAGALGVQLGGRNVYFGRVEQRGLLGDGPRPDARATRRAARLVGWVSAAAAGLAVWCANRRRTQ